VADVEGLGGRVDADVGADALLKDKLLYELRSPIY
jgi:hypothetical protein